MSARAQVSVLVADDHPLYRDAVANAVRMSAELALVAEESTGRAALEAIVGLEPDVAVLDVRMADFGGVEVAAEVAQRKLRTRIVLLSAYPQAGLLDRRTDLRSTLSGYRRRMRAASPSERRSWPPRGGAARRPRPGGGGRRRGQRLSRHGSSRSSPSPPTAPPPPRSPRSSSSARPRSRRTCTTPTRSSASPTGPPPWPRACGGVCSTDPHKILRSEDGRFAETGPRMGPIIERQGAALSDRRRPAAPRRAHGAAQPPRVPPSRSTPRSSAGPGSPFAVVLLDLDGFRGSTTGRAMLRGTPCSTGWRRTLARIPLPPVRRQGRANRRRRVRARPAWSGRRPGRRMPRHRPGDLRADRPGDRRYGLASCPRTTAGRATPPPRRHRPVRQQALRGRVRAASRARQPSPRGQGAARPGAGRPRPARVLSGMRRTSATPTRESSSAHAGAARQLHRDGRLQRRSRAKDDNTGGIHRVHDLGLLLAAAVATRGQGPPDGLRVPAPRHRRRRSPTRCSAKPGKLDEDEWRRSRRHPDEGVRGSSRRCRSWTGRSMSSGATITSGGTAAAIPMAAATRSRSGRASSPSSTPLMRS